LFWLGYQGAGGLREGFAEGWWKADADEEPHWVKDRSAGGGLDEVGLDGTEYLAIRSSFLW
jgi:hypothetical protein